MPRPRIIPVVLVRGGVAVQSRGFRRFQALGHPGPIVARLSDWAADELILLDIAPGTPARERGDLRHRVPSEMLELVRQATTQALMPLCFGGGVRTLHDAEAVIEAGADKVALRTVAHHSSDVLTSVANRFGSQCVVAVMDVERTGPQEEARTEWISRFEVTRREPIDPAAEARRLQACGAGEILLQSVDRDGSGRGYDLELIESVSTAVQIPVIALGGAGEWTHLQAAIDAGAEAAAAANMFQHVEHAVHHARAKLYAAGVPVRPPEFLSDLALHPTIGGTRR